MMSFTNGTFYAFLIAVFFIYWAIAGSIRWRVAFLAAISAAFYAAIGGKALVLLLAMSATDYTVSRLIARSVDPLARRCLLTFSLVTDVAILCVFKYAQFFVEPGGSLALLVAAPIGISFFVFQSLAYVIDVYRKSAEPAPTYFDYLAFATFFPTIVAGPILRAGQMLPQLRTRRDFDAESGGRGLFLIAAGLIKKICIADYLAANLVDRVFDFPERFSSLEVLASVYGYAVQIYADFSGYSDVAIGAALLLGFSVPANFNAPYRAADLTDFWKRWHISLSSWLRDYVFFPISSARPRSMAVLYVGLMATMLVAGVWHGSAWTFVVWGLLHGAGLVVVRTVASLRKRFGLPKRDGLLPQMIGIALTFHFVCLTWIVFRADSLERAQAMLGSIARLSWDTSNVGLPAIVLIAVGLAAHWLPDRGYLFVRDVFVRMPAPAQAAALFGLALGLYAVASSDVAPFIYARF